MYVRMYVRMYVCIYILYLCMCVCMFVYVVDNLLDAYNYVHKLCNNKSICIIDTLRERKKNEKGREKEEG